jgi:hypothetical protein
MVKRTGRVRREIIQYDPDAVCLGKMNVGDSSRMQAAKSTAARLLVTLTLRQGPCTSRKVNRLAVPLRLLDLPRVPEAL